MTEFNLLTGTGGFGVALAVLVVLWRMGIVQFGKNGKNGNGKEMAELRTQIAALQDNHISHLETKLDKVIELQYEIIGLLKSK